MKRIKGEICNLSDLKVGQHGKILELNLPGEMKIHLLEMGFTKNTEVRVKKKAPLGEPVVVELRGYEIFLEKYELKRIQVQIT